MEDLDSEGPMELPTLSHRSSLCSRLENPFNLTKKNEFVQQKSLPKHRHTQQAQPELPGAYYNDYYNFQNGSSSASAGRNGYNGNGFPNPARARGRGRGAGRGTQNSVNRYSPYNHQNSFGQSNYGHGAPRPSPYFRQDHVQNSSWQRSVPVLSFEGPAPVSSPAYYNRPNDVYNNHSDAQYQQHPGNNFHATAPNGWKNPQSREGGRPEGSFYNNHFADNQSQGHGYGPFGAPRVWQGPPRPPRGRGSGTFNAQSVRGESNSNQSAKSQNGTSGHKPWMTPELLKLIRERSAAENKANTTRNPADWYEFKKLRSRVTSALGFAKFDYEIAMGEKQGKSLFHCDPCDKCCFDQASLDAHKAEHMVCKLDGCTFTAHPKIIVKHIQMQHSTDLYEKIAGYDTPEDMKIWIEERKRMFPTKANIERKRLERIERLQRGERISKPTAKRFGADSLGFARRKPNAAAERNNELRRKRFGASYRPVSISGNKSEVVTLKSFYASVRKNSKGVLEGKELTLWTSNTKQKKDQSGHKDNSCTESDESEGDACFTDEEETPIPMETNKSFIPSADNNKSNSYNVSAETKTATDNIPDLARVQPDSEAPKVSGLNALACYGSDSDMEDGEVRDESEEQESLRVPVNHESTVQSSSQIALPNLVDGQEASNKDVLEHKNNTQLVSPKSSSSLPPAKRNGLIRRRKAPARNRNKSRTELTDANQNANGSKPKSKVAKPKIVKKQVRRPLMLEHLLAPEIRKERNGILQICRFILDKKFFDEPCPDISSDEEGSPPKNPEIESIESTRVVSVEAVTSPITAAKTEEAEVSTIGSPEENTSNLEI